ncbi:MAG TPA: hypothetical protein VEK56_08305 [Vicinamibacterales bacterium]|nr:hypothetical protein [Vicinamibacterales bacterium]
MRLEQTLDCKKLLIYPLGVIELIDPNSQPHARRYLQIATQTLATLF